MNSNIIYNTHQRLVWYVVTDWLTHQKHVGNMTAHWVQSDWCLGHLFDFHETGHDNFQVILTPAQGPILSFWKVGLLAKTQHSPSSTKYIHTYTYVYTYNHTHIRMYTYTYIYIYAYYIYV